MRKSDLFRRYPPMSPEMLYTRDNICVAHFVTFRASVFCSSFFFPYADTRNEIKRKFANYIVTGTIEFYDFPVVEKT